MHAAVIVFPGTNREKDMADALEKAGAPRPAMIWHRESELPEGLDLIVVPGGFSYGDYLRCGAMAGNSPVMRAVADQASKGVRVLGVCNGFQVLTETGLLPGVLLRNAKLKFICKHVRLRVENPTDGFTGAMAEGSVIRVPMAHNEGNYFADAETLERLEGDGRVAFRYVDADNQISDAGNDNGSQRSIAGVLNEGRNVLGMMPHPENAIDPAFGGDDGLAFFKSIVQ